MIVTDKKYYLDNNLKDLLDLCVTRQKKKWDNVIIVDGKERSGKTTLATAMAYYFAHETGKKFSLNNVFFDPEKMLEYAIDSEEQVIIWDEAAFGGLSSQWQNKVQQKLNSMLMVTGKYRHTYFFIIPSFFRLNKYLAIDRSLGLIHVYSPDLLTRGYFSCYNEMQKTWIYNNNKKSETYGKSISFRGKFTLKNIKDTIISEEGYEDKKDRAIKSYLAKVGDKTKQKLVELQYKIATRIPRDQASQALGITEMTLSNWGKLGNFAKELAVLGKLKGKT